MKRLAFVALIGVLLIVGIPAFAAASTLTGTITGNQGFVDNFNSDCQPYNDGQVYYYEVYTISVSAAGDYVYTDNGPTYTFLAAYPAEGFDASDPTVNCLWSGGGASTRTFPAAGNYTLVVTTPTADTTGDFSFTLDGPGAVSFVEESNACTQSLPAGSTVRSVPNGAPVFYAADLGTQLTWNLPAGTWWISETSGDFAKVWIGCDANPIWIPASAVAS